MVGVKTEFRYPVLVLAKNRIFPVCIQQDRQNTLANTNNGFSPRPDPNPELVTKMADPQRFAPQYPSIPPFLPPFTSLSRQLDVSLQRNCYFFSLGATKCINIQNAYWLSCFGGFVIGLLNTHWKDIRADIMTR